MANVIQLKVIFDGYTVSDDLVRTTNQEDAKGIQELIRLKFLEGSNIPSEDITFKEVKFVYEESKNNYLLENTLPYNEMTMIIENVKLIKDWKNEQFYYDEILVLIINENACPEHKHITHIFTFIKNNHEFPQTLISECLPEIKYPDEESKLYANKRFLAWVLICGLRKKLQMPIGTLKWKNISKEVNGIKISDDNKTIKIGVVLPTSMNEKVCESSTINLLNQVVQYECVCFTTSTTFSIFKKPVDNRKRAQDLFGEENTSFSIFNKPVHNRKGAQEIFEEKPQLLKNENTNKVYKFINHDKIYKLINRPIEDNNNEEHKTVDNDDKELTVDNDDKELTVDNDDSINDDSINDDSINDDSINDDSINEEVLRKNFSESIEENDALLEIKHSGLTEKLFELTELKGQVTELTGQVTELTGKVTELTELKGRVTELTEKIVELLAKNNS